MEGLVRGILALDLTQGHLAPQSAPLQTSFLRPQQKLGTWNVIPGAVLQP